jgi:hypothetical protein
MISKEDVIGFIDSCCDEDVLQEIREKLQKRIEVCPTARMQELLSDEYPGYTLVQFDWDRQGYHEYELTCDVKIIDPEAREIDMHYYCSSYDSNDTLCISLDGTPKVKSLFHEGMFWYLYVKYQEAP